jgi:hypothetical protein
MATQTYNLDEIFAVTTKYIDKEVEEIFCNTTPLLKEIMKKKEYVDGGNRLTVALDFNPNQSIGYITGTAADLLNVNAQQNLIPAELDWKFMYSNFSITLKDLNATADSKHAIVSLVSQKAKNTLASVRQFLATSFYGSAANNPNAFNGMADIFAASGTSYAGLLDTDLGVDAVGDKKWLPQFDTTSTVCDYQSIEPMLTKLKTKASIEGNASRLGYMVSKAAVLSSFKQKQQMQQRFLPAKDLEVGFDGINVDGVVWYADEFCQGSGSAYKLYLINADSIKFFHKYGFDGKDSPQDVSGLRIPNQPIMCHQKFYTGNLFCVDRRLNGVFTALNPAATRA